MIERANDEPAFEQVEVERLQVEARHDCRRIDVDAAVQDLADVNDATGGEMAVGADHALRPTHGDVVEGMPEAVDRDLGAAEVATVERRSSIEVLEPPAKHRRRHAGHQLVLDPRAGASSIELLDA